VVAEGDRVVVRAVMTGCHRAPFEGIEPSGRRVEARWTFVHELAAGRIVATGMGDDHRWLRDQLSARPLSAPDRTVDVDR
jgi:predicted ester cyclase